MYICILIKQLTEPYLSLTVINCTSDIYHSNTISRIDIKAELQTSSL